MKKISIIIVTYNSEKDIYACIDSIEQNCDIPDSELEVVIVDNNSTNCDTMFDSLRQKYTLDLILIKNSKNGGYGQGNNVGIRNSTAPIILIMNPDVRLYEPIFSKAIQEFNSNEKLSMYGMKQMYSKEKESLSSFNCSNRCNGYLSTVLTGLCNRTDLYCSKYMYLSGSCFFIRRSMFEAIGLFNENVFMYGEEDYVFCRIKEKFGTHIIFDSQLHYIHLADNRKPSITFEKKVMKALLNQNKGFNYPAKKVIKHKLQSVRLILLREKIRKHIGKDYSEEKISVFENFKKYLDGMV